MTEAGHDISDADNLTPEERAFIEDLNAMGKELGEQLEREHFSRGEPLIIERDGVTMLKHPDGRLTPLNHK